MVNCREKSITVIWMDRGVRSLILNEVHVVGLPEKGIFEQRLEGEEGGSHVDVAGNRF